MQLRSVVNEYLTDVGASKARKTFATYTQRLEVFLGWIDAYGHTNDISQVTISLLRNYQAFLRDRKERYGGDSTHPIEHGGLSVDTQHAYLQAVKMFFSWVAEEGYIASSPAVRLKLPRLPRRRPKAVADDDVTRMLFYLRGVCGTTPMTVREFDTYRRAVRDYAILLFLADTGCRVGGLVSMTLDRLFLSDGYALVIEKGDVEREVYFVGVTAMALATWRSLRPKGRSEVWMGHQGPLTTSGVYRMLRRVAAAAGCVGRVFPHGFRHRAAITMLDQGCDLATVSQLLGHSPEVTIRHYARFNRRQLADRHGRFTPLAGVASVAKRG